MTAICLSKNHSLLTSVSDVNAICKPLAALIDLKWFAYVKHYFNQTRIHLDSNPDWALHFYKNYSCYQKNQILLEERKCPSGFYLLANMPKQNLITKDMQDFNIGNALLFIESHQSFQNLFFFGTTPNNKCIIDFYLNHSDFIKNFISYFKEKAQPLIVSSEKDLIALPSLEKPCLVEQSLQLVNDQEVKSSNNLLNFSNHPLSKRELDCIQQLILGKTAFETAKTLHISDKTVENHLANIKTKLGLKRKSQIIHYAYKYSLFSK